MIKAVFFKKDKLLTGFSVSGHAEYDDIGNDIVCASASSAIQFAANLLTDGFIIKSDVKVDKNKITLRVIDSERKDISDKVLYSLYQHLKFLSEDFQDTIEITFSEV